MNELESAVRSALHNGRLPCAAAHRVARQADTPPAGVGAEADRLDLRISRCQLGLFGYKDLGRKGLVTRLPCLPDDLTAALRAAQEDGKVPCAELWRIAREQGLPRVAAGCAAETLDLAISPCQLGCF